MQSAQPRPVKTLRKTSPRAPGPERGPSELQRLINAVREIIAETGTIPPERTVAETLKVKRHLLRRALESLRASGELEPARAGRRASREPHSSTHLAHSTNPLEVMELRMVLEPALARLAALRASPAEIERIQRAASTPAGASPSAADLVFHKAVAIGSRNMLASELYLLLHQVATDSRLRYSDNDSLTTAARIRQRDDEHRRIADAIAARDPAAAERAMWDHLAVVQRKIMGRLAPGIDAA